MRETSVRLFVTGTDTDVGKTRVTAGLARAVLARREAEKSDAGPTIVKLAQTGLLPGDEGDAHLAARLAGCRGEEFARFALPADPWNAAVAEGAAPLEAAALAARLAAIAGDAIVEGSGGAAVPLNARETIAEVARLAGLRAVVAVGLRLGCISHALLTAHYLRALDIDIAGALLVERFEPAAPGYRAQVERGLGGELPLLGTLGYEPDQARGAAQAEATFTRAGAAIFP